MHELLLHIIFLFDQIWAAARHLSALPDPKLAASNLVTEKPVTKAFVSGLIPVLEFFLLELVLPIGICYSITSLLHPEFSFIYTVCASVVFGSVLLPVKIVSHKPTAFFGGSSESYLIPRYPRCFSLTLAEE